MLPGCKTVFEIFTFQKQWNENVGHDVNIRSGVIQWQMPDYLIYTLCNGASNVCSISQCCSQGACPPPPEKKRTKKTENEEKEKKERYKGSEEVKMGRGYL